MMSASEKREAAGERRLCSSTPTVRKPPMIPNQPIHQKPQPTPCCFHFPGRTVVVRFAARILYFRAQRLQSCTQPPVLEVDKRNEMWRQLPPWPGGGGGDGNR